MISSSGVGALAISVLLATTTTVARADDDDRRAQAKALITEAGQLYDEGKHERALEQLRAAYAAYPSPTIHFNLGLTYRALKRELEASESFERFLADAPPSDVTLASRREEARGYLLELEAQTAAIEVVSDAIGARVNVDGRLVGKTPLARPVRVQPGTHRLAVETPFAREDLPVEVRAGERLRLIVRLGAAATAGPTLISGLPPAAEPDRATPLYRRWWVWSAAAFVAAGAVTATALALRRSEPFCDCEAGVVRF